MLERHNNQHDTLAQSLDMQEESPSNGRCAQRNFEVTSTPTGTDQAEITLPTTIVKRDGRVVPFDIKRIETALLCCFNSLGKRPNTPIPELAKQAVNVIAAKYSQPTVEGVQDIVEMVLQAAGEYEAAKHYILYRESRRRQREYKRALGVEDDIKWSVNAISVLEKKFLSKDDAGKVIEKPSDLLWRVARNIASVDALYDSSADIETTAKTFFRVMVDLEFLPNAPTLKNAGRPAQQLAACYVLPVEDSLEEIFETLKHTALIFQRGGGVGYSFGKLRPRGDVVNRTVNIAGGPLGFMQIYNDAVKGITDGGFRVGGMMGVLPVHHPDILDFITSKQDGSSLTNFNISVAITDEFTQAVKEERDYEIANPRTNRVVGYLHAPDVFHLIATLAWKNGDPGLLFIDRINAQNPTSHIGQIEAVNPCGEQPLHPYEACNLGSINLANFVTDGEVNWDRLAGTIHTAVHFLDNVIDMNDIPISQIAEMTSANRRIGLGVMGFADMLIKLCVPYDSEAGLEMAEQVMSFVQQHAHAASRKLARERGSFPNYKGSLWDVTGAGPMRNATVTTIAPTGTLSVLADCNGGIEPLFALAYTNRSFNTSDGVAELEMGVVNPLFKGVACQRSFYSQRLMHEVAKTGSIQRIDDMPEDVKRVFVTAHDIAPEWHIRMQAAFQKYTDNAISKTINFSHEATIEDVKEAFRLAYDLGCKGITVYRDGSRNLQPMTISTRQHKDQTSSLARGDTCPECGGPLRHEEGCATCMVCAFSVCSL